ncbi:AIPR family protein [Streptomyces mayteni]
MNPVHIRQVREALEERFRAHIDMGDRQWPSDEDRDQAFLSRALAALAIQIEHGCGDKEAAHAVFDGMRDQGLDAVGVEPGEKHARISLVQAKWHNKGTAGLGEKEAGRMLDGLDLVLNCDFEDFEDRFQPHVPSVVNAIESGSPKVVLVIALMTADPLHPNVVKSLKRKLARLNYGDDEMVTYKVLDVRDFRRAILGDAGAPNIDLAVTLQNYGRESDPYNAYYGTVSVPEIAAWYERHEDSLFARNIRDPLDVSDVNLKIKNTLVQEPHHFWYLSNGITLLCDTVNKTGVTDQAGRLGTFKLRGASVVNGAQTVSAIHKACAADPDSASRGRVLVRLICLEDCPEGFGEAVTTSTNTQNPIRERDFKSLDATQLRLREDFSLSLHLLYVIKRGEASPPPEDKGCTIEEAATALAALHPDASLAAKAKRDIAHLWERGTYDRLFVESITVYRVWHSVQLLRAVRHRLDQLKPGLKGRGLAAATYGDLLITHVIGRQLSIRSLDAPDFERSSEFHEAVERTESVLRWLLHSINVYGRNTQVLSTLRNEERAPSLVKGIRVGTESTAQPPALNARNLVRPSNGNAVPLLIQHQRISPGTELEFRPVQKVQAREMYEWLAEDERRAWAIWRNDSKAPLVWAVDGNAYSPSGLTRMMRRLASGRDQHVQGTLNWFVPGEGSLVDLAEQIRAEVDAEAEEAP